MVSHADPQLGQSFIRDALASVLNLGYPTALYQLLQVTGNEMLPETVSSLASEFPNFFLFKDTSGEDSYPDHARELLVLKGMSGKGYMQS